jgi:hypothetical protein
MNVLTSTWRQLVRRKLWPVAVLLVAALAAVPVVLAREATPPVVPPDPVPVGAAQAGDEIAEPIVAMAEAGDRDRRRRVLGSRKDPFAPAPLPKRKRKPAAQQSNSKQQTGGTRADEPPFTGGVTPAPDYSPAPSTPVEPVEPLEPAPKKRTFPPDSLIVRFGDATTEDRRKQVLRKLAPLPQGDAVDAETPELLVYMGLTKDSKHAIFLVDASLEATGDGSCKPHPSSCETIHLRKGETEFFDVLDPETGEVTEQFQLDIVDIKTRKEK